MEFNQFFKSAFSVDCVIFGFDGQDLKVLLIKRGAEPYNGKWALPGDLVYPEEDLDAAAKRVLHELAGLPDVYMDQLRAFGKVGRHPMGRVITVAYYSLVKIANYNLESASWAEEATWWPINDLPELAFDHAEILKEAKGQLSDKVKSQPIGFELLPEKFPLTQIQQLYEAVLEVELDKRNFRKKILSMGLLEDLNEMQRNVAHRPAKLYRFDSEKYQALAVEGFSFEF